MNLKLEERKGRWVDDLPEVLWSYRTAPRGSTDQTPFALAFRSEVAALVEVSMPIAQMEDFNEEANNEELQLNLDLLKERCTTTQLQLSEYQNWLARYYNSRVKPRTFTLDDPVLRKIQHHIGVFKPTWGGPSQVKGVVRHGTYILPDLARKLLPHPWKAEALKNVLSVVPYSKDEM